VTTVTSATTARDSAAARAAGPGRRSGCRHRPSRRRDELEHPDVGGNRGSTYNASDNEPESPADNSKDRRGDRVDRAVAVAIGEGLPQQHVPRAVDVLTKTVLRRAL